MKKSQLMVLFLLIIAVNSCKELADDDIGVIKIVNNSIHNILVSESYAYPDTGMNNTSHSCYVSPNQTGEALSLHGWKGDITSNPHGVIILFFTDVDTINKYGSERCRAEYKILKRYELTIDYLERNNWTIYYP